MQTKNCRIDADGPRYGLRCEITHTEIGDKWVGEFQDVRKLVIKKAEGNTGEEKIVVSSGPTISIDLVIASGGKFELLFPDKVPFEKTIIFLTTNKIGVNNKSEFQIHIEKLNRPFRKTDTI